MSEEQNKAVVRRFFEEVWNQQKENVIDEIFASTTVFDGHSITRDTLNRPSPAASRRLPTST